ncbi:MAG: terminase small subunit [Anaerorhabdus sp.]|uniref:terminase small subunit n=1 Tax=Anaerorhabdus sp. TaxID=1872524 RepID=UPI003A84541B
MTNQHDYSTENLMKIAQSVVKRNKEKEKQEEPKGIMITNLFGEDEHFRPFKRQGRPFLYEDENAMINDIVAYFKYCEEKGKPYTTTGLALALGMTRMTLLNYQKDEKFDDIITIAKERVQQYQEEELFGKNTAGAKFSLSANFGWRESTKVEQDIKVSNIESYLEDGKGIVV